jgi:hypothetical protein
VREKFGTIKFVFGLIAYMIYIAITMTLFSEKVDNWIFYLIQLLLIPNMVILILAKEQVKKDIQFVKKLFRVKRERIQSE